MQIINNFVDDFEMNVNTQDLRDFFNGSISVSLSPSFILTHECQQSDCIVSLVTYNNNNNNNQTHTARHTHKCYGERVE